jgi:nucleoside-diphosphate-sugar epimerase
MFTHHLSDPQFPTRVVLLGGNGFVGRNLSSLLTSQGCDVLPLSSRDVDLTGSAAAGVLAEIFKPDDAVVFLSCITPGRGKGVDSVIDNLFMARAVVEALGKSPCGHVVYLSSDAVYPFDNALITEATPAAPTDLYGVMHLARELVLKQAVKVPLAIFRSTLVYGDGDPHNSYGPNRFRRAAAKDGKITLFGGGEETRDHLFVQDLARLIASALRRRSSGVLNAASGRSISYVDLARRVASLFDPRAKVELTPRHNPITHRAFDQTALHMAFPEFSFTTLEGGLPRVHREMRENAHA